MYVESRDRNLIIGRREVGQLHDQNNAFLVEAIDPGGTTGWAMFAVHRMALRLPDHLIMENILWWSAGEIIGPEFDQAAEVARSASEWPCAKIVIEDFILRKFSPDRVILAPVRLTARIQQELADRPVIFQQPSLAMTTITDERLQEMGYWFRGSEHARVSIKHALTYLQRAKRVLAKRTAH
jgi:hypothetical protein